MTFLQHMSYHQKQIFGNICTALNNRFTVINWSLVS